MKFSKFLNFRFKTKLFDHLLFLVAALIFQLIKFTLVLIVMLRWAGHVVRMEEDRRAFKILTGTPTPVIYCNLGKSNDCKIFQYSSIRRCYQY